MKSHTRVRYWMYSMCMTPTYTPVAADVAPAGRLPASAKAAPVCSSRMRDCGSITAASFVDSLCNHDLVSQ